MKKLIAKLLLFIVPVLIYVLVCVDIDGYNVFHPGNVRLTDVTPNQNYIKTRYILDNPDRFNAFVLGSSRAANLPAEGLPAVADDGTALSWYNMTYAMGCIEENYRTVESLINGGTEIKEIIVLLDEISMWKEPVRGYDNPIFTTYQDYEASPLRFYYSYIELKPIWRIAPRIFMDHFSKETDPNEELFYSYGVDIRNTDMETGKDSVSMPDAEPSYEYTDKAGAINALSSLKNLCDDKGIKMVVLTSPLVESTYREAVANGYLKFLRDAADVTDYYLFSGLNTYTVQPKYFFDASHFRPCVGLEMEKAVFVGGDSSFAGELFGAHVTSENADEIISALEQDL